MIQSFGDSETEKIYHQLRSKKLPYEIQKRALVKLLLIDAAESEEDLKVPPGNRFEHLSGRLQGCNLTPKIGDILKEEFLEPLGITPYRLSKEIHVSTSSVLDLVHNKRKITVDMALRLSKFFGTSYKFWLNLQNELDVRETRSKIGAELNNIHSFTQTA